jgi:putative two-component system response regulator
MIQKFIDLFKGVNMATSRSASQVSDISELTTRMAHAAEIKEWDNRDHLTRIRSYCLLLGKQLGLPKSDYELIAVASTLHDVGKLLTPVELLKRIGDYDKNEWKTIEKHTIDGAQLLSGSTIPEVQTGAVIAEAHHERWDGSGYPYHRKGENIPLAARICAVADVFDALTTPRPYKQAIDANDARQMIESSKGVLFDPAVINAFSQVFESMLRIQKTP